MKTLLILGIVYAISLTVVAIILLDHKRRTQTLPVENGWWYPLIVLGAPFIVLVVPVVLIRVLMKRRSREEAQTRRKEKANQKFLKRAYARMANQYIYGIAQSRSAISYRIDIVRVLKQKKDIRLDVFCVLPGTRTLDPLIKSQLLYQLS